MSDLSNREQDHVRAGLGLLHQIEGSWPAVARKLSMSVSNTDAVRTGQKSASVLMAFRVARALDCKVDALLEGNLPASPPCPRCGRPFDLPA